jgi:hypothetical protein
VSEEGMAAIVGRHKRYHVCGGAHDFYDAGELIPQQHKQRGNDERKKHMKIITNIVYLAIALFAFACFALCPIAQAVSPAPDGGYFGANTAEGGAGALFSLTSGTNNTALGSQALFSLTSGDQNTAVGAQALKNNTADGITAIGFQALVNNTTGVDNTAVGWRALFRNTAGGNSNTATGSQALYSNRTGFGNTATGWQALFSNTEGPDLIAGNLNTATGWQALFSNAIGVDNTADGAVALFHNEIGNDNTAIGVAALFHNTFGSSNIAIGRDAGINLTTGDNNIDIGNEGVSGEENTIRIGGPLGIGGAQPRTFITGISGTAVTGAAVIVNSNGQLGVAASSVRFKQQIEPMEKTSEAILALKPVSFHYKKEIDPDHVPQFGLIAEDVAKVNPDLVIRDADGKVYSVRYEAVNAMLLNEFLKEHRIVQEQQKEINALKAELKEQRMLIQRVNDKVELNGAATQTVADNQR